MESTVSAFKVRRTDARPPETDDVDPYRPRARLPDPLRAYHIRRHSRVAAVSQPLLPVPPARLDLDAYLVDTSSHHIAPGAHAPSFDMEDGPSLLLVGPRRWFRS